MTLVEEDVVLAQANRELRKSMQKLHERQRQQTTTLNGLTANLGLDTNDTLTPEIFTNGKDLLNLVDLPGIYSRLIGDLRATTENDKGRLSILALTGTTATSSRCTQPQHRQCLLKRSDVSLGGGEAAWLGCIRKRNHTQKGY